MHWWDLNTIFWRFSAIKNTYWHALVGLKHKIFLAIFSYQENLLICLGGILTQSLSGNFQLSRILIDMHWWGLNTNIFSVIFRYQEYFLTCIGGTLTQFFGDFQPSRILIDMHWSDLNTKSFRRFSAIKNTYLHALVGPEHKIFLATFSYQENLLTCICGTLTWNLFVDFQLSRILIGMHWWDLNTVFWRFSAITNTYWHALVGPKHKIFSTIFSYQEYLFACLGGTWTQNLFGDFQLSRKPIDMHWRDFNTKSLWRFSAIKKTYWQALVWPKHKIF